MNMKRPGFYLIALFILIFLASCSNDSADQEAETTNTASEKASNAPATIVPSDAKEKRSDATAQGLKGKVEVMSETVSFPGDSKKSSSKNVFKYDDKGNRIELANYRADGKLNSTLKTAYDDNGNVTSEQTLLGDGKVDFTSVIKTDSKGNRVEQDDTRAGNNILFNYKYHFKYDEKGQLLERIAYRGNGAFSFKYVFKYDDNGNRTEWIQYGQDNSVVGKVVYKYDAKNNLIEQTEFKKDGSLKAKYTYSHEFDKKNNWIRQKKMVDNKVVEIKAREIKYH